MPSRLALTTAALTALALALALPACTVRTARDRPDAACTECRDGGRRPPPPQGDADADQDGLTNEEEAALGTDPWSIDSDGDGVTDLGEARGTRTDPLDRSDTIDPGDFFVVLPYQGPEERRTLRFSTEIRVADVYFLIDTTGSMTEPIWNVRDSLARIASEIRATVPDVQMGVGHFEDFAREATNPFGGGGFGSPGDVPYRHLADIGPDDGLVHDALASLDAVGGGDAPEAQVEALYQTATGEGGDWTFTPRGDPTHLPARACPSIPDEIGRRRGYPCFRPGSLPIVVMVLDAQWHADPGGLFPYDGIAPHPHSFGDAADALAEIGARYLGVTVNGGGRPEAEQMAIATGAVDVRGTPLVYDAAGGVVSDRIVDAVETLVDGVPQDVTTRTESADGNPDGFDARAFVASIVPVEGYREWIPGPRPGISYASHDDATFFDVIPGTLVDFEVTFRNEVREPTDRAQIFLARIVVIGNGVARLDVRDVYVIVPPEGWVILI